LTNIAQSGSLPPEILNEILDNPTKESTSKGNNKKNPGKQKEKQSESESEKEKEKEKEINIHPPVPDDPSKSLSYLGSSSGYYMLNKLFSQSSLPAFRDASVFSQSLDGDKDDMMALRPQFESTTPSRKEIEWKPPPKELIDHLVTL
jgi:hypothetical protein